MHRRFFAPGALAAASFLLAIPASAASGTPGASGIGDPYYPDYGNGGYDVSHYDLRLTYQPATDRLEGTATVEARTTQDLSSFDLDFLLDVSEVRANGAKADFARPGGHELAATPRTTPAKGAPVTVVIRYSGLPSTKSVRVGTWHRTADGAVAADEPEAAWWSSAWRPARWSGMRWPIIIAPHWSPTPCAWPLAEAIWNTGASCARTAAANTPALNSVAIQGS